VAQIQGELHERHRMATIRTDKAQGERSWSRQPLPKTAWRDKDGTQKDTKHKATKTGRNKTNTKANQRTHK